MYKMAARKTPLFPEASPTGRKESFLDIRLLRCLQLWPYYLQCFGGNTDVYPSCQSKHDYGTGIL